VTATVALVIHRLSDIRWCCGFSGSAAVLLILSDRSILFVDGRYTEQAAAEVSVADINPVAGDPCSAIAEHIRRSDTRTMIFQSDHVTYQRYEKLVDAYPELDYRGAAGLLDELRSVKSESEKEHIRHALSLSEKVLSQIHDLLEPGISEMELATELDYRHRRCGAEGAAFDTIVAFGSNTSLPHASPGGRQLLNGDLVLIDFGCRICGYASDITRMFCIGRPRNRIMEVYAAVEKALQSAVEFAEGGISSKRLDSRARDSLTESGLGQFFSHGLGHGVGLDIHEWPAVNSRRSAVLPGGAIITIEPGVYIPGEFGIRIENMVQLLPGRCEVLNHSATTLTVI
jgi:Xaa-Pro aminopeptidase